MLEATQAYPENNTADMSVALTEKELLGGSQSESFVVPHIVLSSYTQILTFKLLNS